MIGIISYWIALNAIFKLQTSYKLMIHKAVDSMSNCINDIHRIREQRRDFLPFKFHIEFWESYLHLLYNWRKHMFFFFFCTDLNLTCIAKCSLLHWFNFTYIFFVWKVFNFLFAVRIKCNYSCMLTRYMHIMLHEFLYWGRKNEFHKKWINIAEPWIMVHDIVICLGYRKFSKRN